MLLQDILCKGCEKFLVDSIVIFVFLTWNQAKINLQGCREKEKVFLKDLL